LNATVDDIGINEAASGLGALRNRDFPRRAPFHLNDNSMLLTLGWNKGRT
jgi:hypothetical protein